MQRVTAAALFFLNISTVTIGASPSPLETGGDLEQVQTHLHGALHLVSQTDSLIDISHRQGC